MCVLSTIALFINGAILILSAAAFHWSGHQDVVEIQDAYKLLSPVLGVTAASAVFAIGLLASGQQATFTGTLAGQIVMEGFLQFRISPWLRRLKVVFDSLVQEPIRKTFYHALGLPVPSS